MRRLANALLLGAVVVVAAVAIVDATAPPERDRVAEAADALRAAGVTGRLVVAAPDCTRREIALPSLRQRPLGVVACAAYGRPGSLAVYRGGVVWAAFPGGTTTLLRRRDLEEYLGRPARVLRVAWLGNIRFAASYRAAGADEQTLAIFERSRLVRVLARAPRFEDVRSSPRGRFLSARAGDRVALWDVLGDRVPLPEEAERAAALAWPPDERWTAAAGREGTLVFRTATTAVVARIPAGGVDVDWTVDAPAAAAGADRDGP